MLNSAVVIFAGLVAVRCAIIAALCFAFWHWLKLRALPWVGAWYIAGFVAELIGGYYFVQWAPPEWKTHGRLPPPPGLAALSLSMGLLAEISALLAVLLIFSEAAFVMRRLYP